MNKQELKQHLIRMHGPDQLATIGILNIDDLPDHLNTLQTINDFLNTHCGHNHNPTSQEMREIREAWQQRWNPLVTIKREA